MITLNWIEKNLKKSLSISQEILILLIISMLFLGIGIHFASRSWQVWMDEVMFAEPAVNLYFGKGFHSYTWFQPANEFTVTSCPLYILTIYGWLKLFGFHITSVRLLNYTLTLASAWMLWLATIRLKLIRTTLVRIVFFLLILTGWGITSIYISGRYDSLSMTMVAATVLAGSIFKPYLRYGVLIFLGVLYPLVSLTIIPYSLIIFLLLFLYKRKMIAGTILSVLLGELIGFGILYSIFWLNGVADSFMNLTFGAASADHSINIMEKIYLLFDKNKFFCIGALQDSSFQRLWFILIVIIILQLVFKKTSLKSLITFQTLSLFALVVSILIPVGMCVSYRYPWYYSWMAYMPLALCVCSTFDQLWTELNNAKISLFLLTLFLTLSLSVINVGLPLSIKYTKLFWDSMDYSRVEKFVQDNIKPEDKLVYSDFSPFYAIKTSEREVLFPPFPLSSLSGQEKNSISVIVYNDAEEKVWTPTSKKIMEQLGGEWEKTNQLSSNGPYNLTIYRRK